MLKRVTAMVLLLVVVSASFGTVSAASGIERVYLPEMHASVGYHGGEKYIALDVVIRDITEPTGLLSIGFDVLFDGDALVPLWQTDKELNGDGTSIGKYSPPQMITNWPFFYFNAQGQQIKIFAAEGLCKAYNITGKGVLNVNLLVNIDFVEDGVTEDGAFAIRLYFTPTAGFRAGDSYTFTIDGEYDETIPQRVGVEGTSNSKPMPKRVLGYGSSASITLTYADTGAFDLSEEGIGLGIIPDGAKDIIWVKEGIGKAELAAAFKSAKTVNTAGSDSAVKRWTVSGGGKTLTAAVKGDINLDGTQSTADYLLLAKKLQGGTDLDELQSKIADINGNGAITTADATLYLRSFGE